MKGEGEMEMRGEGEEKDIMYGVVLDGRYCVFEDRVVLVAGVSDDWWMKEPNNIHQLILGFASRRVTSAEVGGGEVSYVGLGKHQPRSGHKIM